MNRFVPRPKGPPLNALRAFETAARCGSFTAASDELCVTPGAIAQHIKTLEAWAGGKLFTRKAHGVELTDLGSDVLPRFVDAFDSLGDAVQALRTRAMPNQVRIVALPSVAQMWLSPRLPEIRRTYSDLSISVFTAEVPPNLKREQFDLAIFYEDLPADPAHIEIDRDIIFPVCSPQIAKQLTSPADLNQVTCLHDASWQDDWTLWVKGTAQADEIHTTGPSYSLYSLMLEEARNHAGIMIGHKALVQDLIETGELVAPFKEELCLKRCLSIATQANDSNESILQQLVASLIAPANPKVRVAD